jgi:predicted Rossmann fold nucleotide-binding protein DprA/Smf involved in DNA uptake
MLGNRDIWALPKVAFLCSSRYSPGSVLKSYDWAEQMKRSGQCVISGFQSRLEADVMDILLTGTQPIIMALARGLYRQVPPKLRPHIESGRLLLVSPFDQSYRWVNSSQARRRNQMVVDNADSIVFAHVVAGGMLERLTIPDNARLLILDT